jgi:hypothetical protein
MLGRKRTVLSAIAFGLSALFASNAIADIVCDAQLPAWARTGLKWDPGHYIAIGGDATNEFFQKTLTEISTDARMAKVVGIQKRYYWSDLQDLDENDLHFEQLRADINAAKLRGKKLSIMLMWKFKTDGGKSPIPTHVQTVAPQVLPDYGNVEARPFYKLNADGKSAHGFIANLGHPVVANKLIRFLVKLAKEVDGKDTVSSIVFAETALGFKSDKPPYEPEDILDDDPMTATDFKNIQKSYMTGVARVIGQAGCAFRKTPVIQMTNFPTFSLPDMQATFQKFGVGMGSPDIWWKDSSVLPAYSIYPTIEAEVPTAAIIAGGDYEYESHEGELKIDRNKDGKIDFKDVDLNEDGKNDFLLSTIYGWDKNTTVIKLAQKAVNTTFANFIFWKKNGIDGDDYYEAFKEEIAKLRPGSPAPTIPPTRTKCPTDYYGKCVRD